MSADPSPFTNAKSQKIRGKGANAEVRMRFAVPVPLRCTACGAFIARMAQYNAWKSTLSREAAVAAYEGRNLSSAQLAALSSIKVYSFRFGCPGCSAKVEVLSDPFAADYMGGENCTVLFQEKREEERLAAERAMKAEEAKVGPKDAPLLSAVEERAKQAMAEEAELAELDALRLASNRMELARRTAHAQQATAEEVSEPTVDESVDAAAAETVDRLRSARSTVTAPTLSSAEASSAQADAFAAAAARVAERKRKRAQQQQEVVKKPAPAATRSHPPPPPPSTLTSLVSGYDSSSSSSSSSSSD
jgi:hypothetical protein